ncbi:unnamed protein product [Vitrella brassicaformis CCMP3155]|uniref:Uncharacterized protein n=1 Tax=Vitrella brassicaformis (strain CCMP3155) TaxID=1169540 RepID=A0A0G4GGC7_VITBC|nr:unnamed protein product [Vitrella brassicaformis CCMP3155]|eukprot:CEM28672.1 unnamed protein product [Vitrella brassicaformis CCMP3155]
MRCVRCPGASAKLNAKQGVSEGEPVLSTDHLFSSPGYKDNKTLIAIWGKWPSCPHPLSVEANRLEEMEGSTATHPDLPLPSPAASSLRPLVIEGLAHHRVKQVATGTSHLLFLTDVGKVYVFGYNFYGQLGLGTTLPFAHTLRPLQRLPVIQQIAAGDAHSIALSDQGEVFTWGCGDAVGFSDGLPRATPTLLDFAPPPEDPANDAANDTNNERIDERSRSQLTEHSPGMKRIAACGRQSVAITSSAFGTLEWVYGWGELPMGVWEATPRPLLMFQAGMGNRLEEIALGRHFGLVRTGRGEVFSWGDGSYGELGRPSEVQQTATSLFQSVQDGNDSGSVLSAALVHLPSGAGKMDSIAAGGRHALMLGHDGRVWAMGDNTAGQCGVNVAELQLTQPKCVASPSVSSWEAKGLRVAAGGRHSACITQDHRLLVWGHASHHKLIYTATPAAVPPPSMTPGVSVRSGLKECSVKPRLVFSLLHRKVTDVVLGEDFTVVVTGEGEGK